MGEADVRDCVGRVLAALRDAGRSEGTVRLQQGVLDRFAAFLAWRGLDTASDRVCIEFIANQTGVRLGSLRESVKDRGVQAVRRPVVLMADALAGREIDVDGSVIPAKDDCPVGFRPLRDDYLDSCRRRGNASAPRRECIPQTWPAGPQRVGSPAVEPAALVAKVRNDAAGKSHAPQVAPIVELLTWEPQLPRNWQVRNLHTTSRYDVYCRDQHKLRCSPYDTETCP